MFFQIIRFSIFILGLFYTGQSSAGGKINLVTGNDYAPFTDQSLDKGGLATAVVSAVFKDAGYETDISWKPWKRGFIESKNASYIGTFPYIPTVARQKDFLYSDPIFTQTYVALTNIKEKGHYKTYEDMKGKTVCRPVGYAISDEIENNVTKWKINLFQPSDMSGCMKAVMRLKNQIVVLNSLQANEERKKSYNDFNKLKVHPLSVKGFTLHFIVSKEITNAQQWIDRFNKSLKNVRKSGLYLQLAQEFSVTP